MLALAVRDLEVRFAGLDTPALAVPDLALAAGERVAVTGASGSGKTTLVNMLTGLDRATRGSIRWGDTDIAALPERRRDRWRGLHVGLVMQDFHLFPGLSALDNVLLPMRLRLKRPDAGMRLHAVRLLDRVGIARHAQSAETLSRGQMQRVAVAGALVGRPGLLVADEPTASLDEAAGGQVADLLLELAAETGTTLIVASHDPRLVSRLGRELRLENGRIRASGP
ncbi:ABC transporter ATP-binding protein [Aureimonas leprariae]|uniref:ABC transporter ATP-binding protein n=1 Tax=Plantimonas leprariae TaxID=2615207 RepID=A0A7V7PQ42_9HYPH|nr:ABC transporter ATP-binding protein [Aureimonas leprariae]KAB0680201.1 ABC transporter ATP-binding protein [Aureimonas leprariae]